MRVASAWSKKPEESQGVEEAFAQLCAQLPGVPNLLLLYSTVRHDGAKLLQRLRALAPEAAIQGSSSLQAVMTESGFFDDSAGPVLALLGVHDPEGAYGAGAAEPNGDLQQACRSAIDFALRAARRPGEVPAALLLSCAPAQEERILGTLREYFGTDIPIVGGSSAGNSVGSTCQQYCGAECYSEGIVVGALFPSTSVTFSFQSGYEPAEKRGIVTRSEGRRLYEIDGRPACDVYDEWTDGALGTLLHKEASILAQTTMHPLGRVVGSTGGVESYVLAHPALVHEDGSLTLFADAVLGQPIVLMQGTLESLVQRAGRVGRSVIRLAGGNPQDVAGALVHFCAGCMLTVRERMPEVAADLRDALAGRPFVCAFTFGEQGCFPSGQSVHGNLMVSTLAFCARPLGE